MSDWPLSLAQIAAKFQVSERICREWVAAARRLCPGHVFYTGTERKKRFEEHHYELLIVCLPAAVKARREAIGRPRRGTQIRPPIPSDMRTRSEAAFQRVKALARGEG